MGLLAELASSRPSSRAKRPKAVANAQNPKRRLNAAAVGRPDHRA